MHINVGTCGGQKKVSDFLGAEVAHSCQLSHVGAGK